jgi:hypothetical protein
MGITLRPAESDADYEARRQVRMPVRSDGPECLGR